jgi:hypothetical protein
MLCLFPSRLYYCRVSTAREIEEAIRSLSPSERDKLLHNIPDLFPEFSGDQEWERINRDERSRPALKELLDQTETKFRHDPDKFSEITDADFSGAS